MVALFFLAGLVLVLVVLQDAFEVMLLPRRVQRRVRLARLYFRSTWVAWRAMATRLPQSVARERFLGVYGPLSMVVLFMVWAGCLVVGFGLLQWALNTLGGFRITLASQLYLSGVTFFTLGYGEVLPRTTPARALAVVEAGIGLGFLAVVIGYLPVLYQFLSRRESHVIQLDGRAGSPPTAAALLCRHAESDGMDKVDELLYAWESWGAELLESHLSYPMLAFYRSQHDDHSWLAGLTAVMDACALILVGVEDLKPLQARMTFSIARHVVLEMARALHVRPAQAAADRLPHEAYATLEAEFAHAEIAWRGGMECEETLQRLRATYEPMLQSLAQHLLIPLPPWTAEKSSLDHWERGLRGRTAKRIVQDLADRTASHATPDPQGSDGE